MAWNSTLKALSFRRKILKGTSERNKEPRNQRNMGQHGHKNSTSYGPMIQMFQMLIYGAKIQIGIL